MDERRIGSCRFIWRGKVNEKVNFENGLTVKNLSVSLFLYLVKINLVKMRVDR